MFYYVYALRCDRVSGEKPEFYVGYSEDLKRRLKEHIDGNVTTTKKFDKITLVYYEASLSKRDARKRELQLKTGFGRGYLKRRLEGYLTSLRD